MATLTIEQHGGGVVRDHVRWSDEIVCDINAFENAIRLSTDPELPPKTAGFTRAFVEQQDPSAIAACFIGRNAAGEMIGDAWVIGTTTDNAHYMFSMIQVGLASRQSGVATALLARVVQFTKHHERGLVVLGSDRHDAASDAFATSLGVEPAFRAHVNQLRIADVPPGLIEEWNVVSNGYAIEWIDGETPEELMADVIHLEAVLQNTAPMDDMPIEERVVTAEQIRASEARAAASGGEQRVALARHIASGEAVGYTCLFYDAHAPRFMHQGATAVDPGHRGHRLGRWLKAAMFARAINERPDAEFIRTFNADSNEHMLAINNAMGFQPLFEARRWPILVADAEIWLEKRQ